MTDKARVYEYENVRLIRVIDGDTVELDIDQGNHCHWVAKFRLAGIDAPEMHGGSRIDGDAAKLYLEKLLQQPIQCVQTDKPDKYGRWLVTIYTARLLASVNQRMMERGHAKPYDGGAKP